jgi:hypothetical protein
LPPGADCACKNLTNLTLSAAGYGKLLAIKEV